MQAVARASPMRAVTTPSRKTYAPAIVDSLAPRARFAHHPEDKLTHKTLLGQTTSRQGRFNARSPAPSRSRGRRSKRPAAAAASTRGTSTRATTRQSDARSKRRGEATRRDAISREARFGRRSSARDDDTDGNRVASDASRRDLSIRPRGAGARRRARRSTGATARGKREIKARSRSLAVRRALGRR